MNLAPATRPALTTFRDDWISDGGANTGLDIYRCTVYGGFIFSFLQLSL